MADTERPNIIDVDIHERADTHDLLARTKTFRGSDLQEAFKGFRKNKAGEKVEITVEVLDAGDGAGSNRYVVSAYSLDGKEAHGTGAATLEEALPNVRWDGLD